MDDNLQTDMQVNQLVMKTSLNVLSIQGIKRIALFVDCMQLSPGQGLYATKAANFHVCNRHKLQGAAMVPI